VQVDVAVTIEGIEAGRAEVARLEELGVDGLVFVETAHDPFVPIVLAAEHTRRVQLRTGIVVAFARNPMTVALPAHDLQALSGGRFVLGLGTQVRAHIERRYSMPWSSPTTRLRDFVAATRAIWACWDDGVPLRHEGPLYRHTLMSPQFSPPPNPTGPPPIALAAVGERLTELAGEVADGLILHGFCTSRYVERTMLPALGRGLAASGRTRGDVEVSGNVWVVTGDDDAAVEQAEQAVRRQIAFYGSTLAYRPVLEAHGWGELQAQLGPLARAGDWDAMTALVDEALVDAFAVRGTPEAVGPAIAERFAGVYDRVRINTPYRLATDVRDRLLDGLVRAAAAG
jgi:probable F420-dependent oxidoreductase